MSLFILVKNTPQYRSNAHHIIRPTLYNDFLCSHQLQLLEHSTHEWVLLSWNLHFSDASISLFSMEIINLDCEISSKIYFNTNLNTPKITQCIFKYRFRIWTSYVCVWVYKCLWEEKTQHKWQHAGNLDENAAVCLWFRTTFIISTKVRCKKNHWHDLYLCVTVWV